MQKPFAPLCTVLSRLLLFALFVFPAGPASAEQEDFTLYKMAEGDTLESVAEQYLGGPEFVDELLGYNEISNALTVGPGTMLAVPLQVRDDAIQALSRAENALARAVDEMAESFAEAEFTDATESADEARAERLRGEYSKALAKAELAFVKAEDSARLAAERARVQQEATITSVTGQVELSRDGGQSWAPVGQGSQLPVLGQLRTADGARAEITLAEGSVIQVAQGTVFELQNFLLDRRDGVRNSKLKVIMGSILGNVEPRKVDESVFEIDTGGASIAIRGTALRVGAEGGTSRLSVLAGLTSIAASGAEEQVPASFGSVVEEGQPPAKPIPLFPPPTGLVPPMMIHHTAVQTPEFRWSAVADRDVSGYRLEIARDPLFNQVVQDHVVTGSALEVDVLPQGTYYWHVSTIDKNGLEGRFGPTRQLRVRTNTDVRIVPSEPLQTIGGKQVASSRMWFRAEAARKDSSVVRIEYSLDGTTYEPMSGGVMFEEDGDRNLWVRGVTAEGQAGSPQQLAVRVDGTPPDLDVQRTGPSPVAGLGDVVTIAFQASDNTAVDRIEYSVDGVRYVEYDQPLQFAAGDAVRVFATAYDVLGNQSDAVTVDLGAPAEAGE